MGANNPSAVGIKNYGLLETGNNSQYIGLIGGDVTIDGGFGGRIIAPGGRVDLGGLNTAGTVSIDDKGFVYVGSGIHSDVSLINGAHVFVNADGVLGTVNAFLNNAKSPGGTINVSANNLQIVNDPSTGRANAESASLETGLNINSGKKITPSGDININATGKISLNNGGIYNRIESGSEGNTGNINITTKELNLGSNSFIDSSVYGKGNAGNIDIKASGDITLNGGNYSYYNGTQVLNSAISSNTFREGDTGKISIGTNGKLSLFNSSNVSSQVAPEAIGNSKGIDISARELELRNSSGIRTDTYGRGNAGDINIKTTGDINIAGTDTYYFRGDRELVNNLKISSDTFGTGNTGRISIDTKGKLLIDNNNNQINVNDYFLTATGLAIDSISSKVAISSASGNSQDISIIARELELKNGSMITTKNYGKGIAGDINIKTTGDIKIIGYDPLYPLLDILFAKHGSGQCFSCGSSEISGNKVSIETQGRVSLLNNADISSFDRGVNIGARELYINNYSNINSSSYGTFNAGDINIKTTNNITIDNDDKLTTVNNSILANYFVSISSKTYGSGSAGNIAIKTQGKLFLYDGSISSSGYYQATGNSKNIDIVAQDIDLRRRSRIASENVGDGSAGNTYITAQRTINIEDSLILADSGLKSIGLDRGGDIVISSDRLNLKNGGIFSDSSTLRGGNITLTVRDRLLMQPDSAISTNSTSTQKNGDGGNITISSPLIISTPGNSDISANAAAGSGGKVNITSQGLFGIQFRPKGQDSLRTNDITASSTFGQNGTVDINTPGLDPGKDATQLPIVPIDATNQISQTCSPDKRDSNFAVTGRGGLPKNARDLLANDVLWQDPRANERSIAKISQPQSPQQLPSPAIGWVADGKGKITLVAAESQAQPIGTRASCPNQ